MVRALLHQHVHMNLGVSASLSPLFLFLECKDAVQESDQLCFLWRIHCKLYLVTIPLYIELCTPTDAAHTRPFQAQPIQVHIPHALVHLAQGKYLVRYPNICTLTYSPCAIELPQSISSASNKGCISTLCLERIWSWVWMCLCCMICLT